MTGDEFVATGETTFKMGSSCPGKWFVVVWCKYTYSVHVQCRREGWGHYSNRHGAQSLRAHQSSSKLGIEPAVGRLGGKKHDFTSKTNGFAICQSEDIIKGEGWHRIHWRWMRLFRAPTFFHFGPQPIPAQLNNLNIRSWPDDLQMTGV